LILSAVAVAAEAEARVGHAERARSYLARMPVPSAGTSASERSLARLYWEHHAKVAEVLGQAEEAKQYRARAAALEHPGEGSRPSAWDVVSRPLPDFDLVDLEGRHWTRANLAGKRAVIDTWATWCGPCKEELPHLNALADRLKERKDVILLSWNIDQDAGLVEPFAKQNALRFPILLAASQSTRLIGDRGIPQTWLVDATGVVRVEATAWGVGDQRWEDELLAKLESLAPASP
jgi:thiol-disulfide isomerase/thioredoxin